MDKGWGLTLESSDQVGVFGTKSSFTNNRDRNLIPMFPLNSSNSVSPPELDFFSGKASAADDAVKKEPCPEPETGLRLVINAAKTGSDQSTVDDGVSADLDDRRAKIELAQLRVEMERMNAENQKLRGMLTQVGNNYAALQMQFVTLMKQPQISHSDNAPKPHQIIDNKSDEKEELVPRQFLDLSPGAGRQVSDEQSNSSSEERREVGDDVVLSGNKRDESPEPENWAPNKSPKLNPPKPDGENATMRKARVSVRARSEAPMISDGCQWRKYGQKMAKGNPCPRAYYRCTMAVACPVRKQVQRCAEDQTILITTYEGTHNHPLPPAAMAMVSTTSAAATMLLSGSMPSSDTLTMQHPNFLARTMLPCSSNMATISATAPFPTITLDLTQSPNTNHFQRPQFPTPIIPPQFFGQAVNYNQSRFTGLQMSQLHQGTEFRNSSSTPSFADTLSAATAAITKDPNFTAALVAAISSVIGGGQADSNGQNSSNGNLNVNTNVDSKNN